MDGPSANIFGPDQHKLPAITSIHGKRENKQINNKGLTAYVDSLYSTYLVVLIRLSYDDSIYLVIENMTYD